MENRTIGTRMGLAAQTALLARAKGESALSILDKICSPYHGLNADFDAWDPADARSQHPVIRSHLDAHPQAALGMLMVEAFAPDGLADLAQYQPAFDKTTAGTWSERDDALDLWYVHVEEPFRKRYDFS